MLFQRNFVLFIVASLSISACANTPPELYLIDGDLRSQSNSTPPALIVGVGRVSLPSYANDVRIARRAADGRLILEDDFRWAEPPEESLTRVLSLALERQLEALAIPEPFPRGAVLDLRISMTVDQFLQTEDDTSLISGIITYQSGDGRETLHIERYSFEAALRGSSAEDYARGVSENLQDIAAVVAEQVAKLNDESRRGLGARRKD